MQNHISGSVKTGHDKTSTMQTQSNNLQFTGKLLTTKLPQTIMLGRLFYYMQ